MAKKGEMQIKTSTEIRGKGRGSRIDKLRKVKSNKNKWNGPE